ncbi:sphingosine 1-phosphate receptor 4-like [Scleropages formosus]|uniref:Sphingosine 1-phosphate receptor 4-like n=1 Tax=Scleropages formosus TaxID=113540 RepID=A0A0P7YG48_SCLFO|nr:sphingosine 1-phosphate receptor 4-like [Scleropages formosus]
MLNRNKSDVILGHYNYTGRLHSRQLESRGVSLTKAMFLAISVLIILENLVVLLAVIFRSRQRSRWVFVCIANITLSDLLAGIAYVVNLVMSGSRTFRLSPSQWLFREGVLFVALAASVFSLLLIAVERYTTMIKPLHQKSAWNTCRIYALVALCWLMAFVMGFLPMLGWNCICQMKDCSTLLPLYSKSYILFSLIIFFIILTAIGMLYGAIYCHVRSNTEVGSQRIRRRSLRLLKTVISIVGVFVVCWGPLFFLLMVDFSCHSRQCALLYGADWVIALAVLNSAINPLIYSFGSTELRRAIAGLLCCCCVKAGLCDWSGLLSKETDSTSSSCHRHSSLRNSFSRVRSMSTSPQPAGKPKKPRLSSTTSCLSVSSG